ncbi:3'(2'),5'-bisphosphate nucleotidase CysQ [Arthrobacter castelli]|uniref:3'(2'),5'-bisphosphate nucleotidase CysQ n=1 Tax=Arthrobacter castelli TaxID=271431 RepID=UPI0003F9AB0A|nr:3'(2'),5'-bisphosphate nucleotidase CysQ [Arthrobacter castelli]
MDQEEWLKTEFGHAEDDATFAHHLAEAAGRALADFRTEALAEGLDGKKLKDQGDARSQQLISSVLRFARPHDAVLSEEATDSEERLSAGRVWIIDPLDGTREYSEDRHDWAVHVALWSDGSLVAGAVALPGLDTVLSTGREGTSDATVNGRRPKIAVSRSRAPQLVTDVADILDAELVPMGSAGYKAAAVIRGEVDAYIHAGGQYEWDSAAPVAVAQARRLHTSRIDGSSLRYNQADPYLPDLLVCRADLADQLLNTISKVK